MRIAILLGLILSGATPLLCQENSEVIWQRLQSSDEKHLYRFSIPPQADVAPPRSIEAWLAPPEINRIEIVDRRLVVLGSIGTSANTVTVFDLNQPEKHRSFLCWQPWLSSSGRYILYQAFYPRFSGGLLTSAVVGAFDVLGPLDSAPGGELVTRGYPLSNLGQPLYPVLNARRRTFERGIDGVYHLAYLRPEYVRWFASDRGVVFLDRTTAGSDGAGQKTFKVVVVRMAENYGDPTIEEYPLSAAQRDRFLAVYGAKEMKLDLESATAVLELKNGDTIEVSLGEGPLE